jgi:hypothetical protein
MLVWRLNPCYQTGIQRSRTVAACVRGAAFRLTVFLHQHVEDGWTDFKLRAEGRNVSERGETWNVRELAHSLRTNAWPNSLASILPSPSLSKYSNICRHGYYNGKIREGYVL